MLKPRLLPLMSLACLSVFSIQPTLADTSSSAPMANVANPNYLPFLAGPLVQEKMLAAANVPNPKNKTYVLPAVAATTQWGVFDNQQPPVLKIRSGDTVMTETLAASDNQVIPGVTAENIQTMNNAVPGRGPHTLTGPIYVEGAEPGDVLRIHLNKIVPRPYGSNDNLPGRGLFPDKFPTAHVKYFYLDTKNMRTQFAPGIVVPLHPFPGIIAVAQAQPGKLDSDPPGNYGGNMDLRELTEGTTLYLPVFVKGGLVWTGDSHAVQGNGEINLTALETSYAEFSFTIDVVKNRAVNRPLVETPTSWITVGYDTDLNKALDSLKAETIRFIMAERNVPQDKAEQIMYANWNCPISEVVNGVQGTYCIIPKDHHAAKPAPLLTQDTATQYVTYAKNADVHEAMREASWAMLQKLEKFKHMKPLDAYSLASLTMDCRIAPYHSGDKEVHCTVDKSLWVK